MYLARVYVTLKPTVNDPQGQTVLGGLKSLSFDQVQNVRMGKYLEIRLSGKSPASALQDVEGMCRQLLANPVIEDFRFDLEEVSDQD